MNILTHAEKKHLLGDQSAGGCDPQSLFHLAAKILNSQEGAWFHSLLVATFQWSAVSICHAVVDCPITDISIPKTMTCDMTFQLSTYLPPNS